MKRSLDNSHLDTWLWLAPLLFMIVVGLYFLIRFDGYWAETDSANFTSLIRDFISQGKLVPQRTPVYPNGYVYQAISTFLVSLTGLKLETLQQWVYPLLAAITVLPAWITYRELTGSPLGATLATLLLFTQPEFLFVILRSSHEKFTRALMLVCLFLLFRSISPQHSFKRVMLYVGLFYFTVYAFIASNFLLANSFIFALAIAYAAGWLAERLNPKLRLWNRHIANRLQYIIPVCIGLVYIFTVYLYPPARHNLGIAKSTWALIKTLILNLETQRADLFVAYDYTFFGWVSLPTYFMVSIADWLVLLFSSVVWLYQGWSWFRRAGAPKSQMAWLLWLLYAAFVIQEVLALISDASGALSSNLQLRLFPSFSMIAVAILGAQVADWQPRRFKRIISFSLTGALLAITIVSVWKATNEPLLSNKWNFYQPNEVLALQWEDAHLHDATIWTEFDERLNAAYLTLIGYPSNRFTNVVTPDTRDMLASTIIRLRSHRIGRPIPIPPDAFQIYDNGTAQLFHLRPSTPYQP